MKKLFVIGGMGAGKSTATKVLVDQGLPLIDLDKVGHDVLTRDYIKHDLVEAFGDDILDTDGEISRPALAAKAFVDERRTRILNSLTMPRIEETFADLIDAFDPETPAVVIEYSAFRDKTMSLASDADCIIAVVAPVEARIARAVTAGWDEADVRNRIARQITDTERMRAADVVFQNDSTPEALREQVESWWNEYKKTI